MVHLPPGGRWTDGAPSRWQVNATAAGWGTVTARFAAGAVTQTGPAEGTAGHRQTDGYAHAADRVSGTVHSATEGRVAALILVFNFRATA